MTDIKKYEVEDEDEMVEEIDAALHSWFQEFGTSVKTQEFREAGVLTRDSGLVVTVDGKRFYVTVQEA